MGTKKTCPKDVGKCILPEACVGTMVMSFPYSALCQLHTVRDAATNSPPVCFKITQFEKLMCNLATRLWIKHLHL